MDRMMRARATGVNGGACPDWFGTVRQFVKLYPLGEPDKFGVTWHRSGTCEAQDVDTIFEIRYDGVWVEIPDPRYGYVSMDEVSNPDLLAHILGEEIVIQLPVADDGYPRFVPTQRPDNIQEATPEEYYAHRRSQDGHWQRVWARVWPGKVLA